jgi:membrane-bound lytic murein transglycosylase A
MRIRRVSALMILCLAACRSAPDYSRELPPGTMALRKITDPLFYPDFGPGFDRREGLAAAVDQSLAYLAKPSSKQYFPYLDISHDRVVRSLQAFKEILAKAASGPELNRTIAERFDVYESVGWDGSGIVLFTAYCEPIYSGSLTQTADYRCPLYRLPPDLVKDKEGKCLGRKLPSGELGPYPTRREIDEGNLLKGQELVWLRDPLEPYIIHVQGSGRIRLTDGREMRVGYAGKTDRPYVSLGKELIKDGKIRKEELSLQRIKDYFRAHPEQVREYCNRNESYVFFTERQGGPYGSLNVPLSPLHSIATDKAVFPRAGLSYAVTTLPQETLDSRPFSSFLLDQDTGGAIRSAGRADIYYGSGPEAELRAGYTQNEGRLYYIFVKEGVGSVSGGGMSPELPPPGGVTRPGVR